MSATSRCYLVTSWLDNRAVCGCGHTGKRRVLRANAAIDVATHCQLTGHTPMGRADWRSTVYFR